MCHFHLKLLKSMEWTVYIGISEYNADWCSLQKGDGHLEENGELLSDEKKHVPPHQGWHHRGTVGAAAPKEEHEEKRLLHPAFRVPF